MILGLTGGIASGKSTVSSIFKNLGIQIYDADVLAKEVSERKDIISAMVSKFGSSILDANGHLDRNALKNIVFNDRSKLHELNEMIHPEVLKIYKQIKSNVKKDEIVIFDIPLLFESKVEFLCDKILTIGVSHNIQIKRIMTRDNVDKTLAQKIISSQMPLEEKIKKSDYIIMNDENMEALEKKVLNLYKKLCTREI